KLLIDVADGERQLRSCGPRIHGEPALRVHPGAQVDATPGDDAKGIRLFLMQKDTVAGGGYGPGKRWRALQTEGIRAALQPGNGFPSQIADAVAARVVGEQGPVRDADKGLGGIRREAGRETRGCV